MKKKEKEEGPVGPSLIPDLVPFTGPDGIDWYAADGTLVKHEPYKVIRKVPDLPEEKEDGEEESQG